MIAHPRAWLIVVLCLDGLGVATLTTIALVTARTGVGLMAAFAAGGWVLALASVPRAVRAPTPQAVKLARIRVWAGLGVTVLGAVWAAVDSPSVLRMAMVLLVAGVAVSAAYLALLRRLADARGEPG